MIKTVTVTNHRGDSVVMELRKPTDSGFAITEIEGLGPVSANINTTEIVSYDGSIFNSSRGTERNIVFHLTFLGIDIEEIRHKTYLYFPLKQLITIKVETDHRLCETTGYVESNEPDIFADDGEGCTISVICPDSWFDDVSEEGQFDVSYWGIDPLFEFPFSNESLIEDLIEFGNIRNSFEETFYYDGEVDTGFVLTIHALGDVGDITIYNSDTLESMTIDADKLAGITGSALKSGDDLIISTVKGRKSARLMRDAKYTNVLNCIGRGSVWFQLSQGENKYAYVLEEGSANIQLTFDVQNLFQGV